MRILVTNDDGIASPGLQALVDATSGTGNSVRVIAPRSNWSDAGTAVGNIVASGPLMFEPALHVTGIDQALSYDGPPALAVVLDEMGAFGKPADLVLSGINQGSNCGRMIYHSGTVGGALTAAAGGRSGIAISLEPPYGDEGFHWSTATAIARCLILGASKNPLPPHCALNVNVPAHDVGDLRGWRSTTLAPHGLSQLRARTEAGHSGSVRVTVSHEGDARRLDPEFDSAALFYGFVSVSEIGLASTLPDRNHDGSGLFRPLIDLLGPSRPEPNGALRGEDHWR